MDGLTWRTRTTSKHWRFSAASRRLLAVSQFGRSRGPAVFAKARVLREGGRHIRRFLDFRRLIGFRKKRKVEKEGSRGWRAWRGLARIMPLELQRLHPKSMARGRAVLADESRRKWVPPRAAQVSPSSSKERGGRFQDTQWSWLGPPNWSCRLEASNEQLRSGGGLRIYTCGTSRPLTVKGSRSSTSLLGICGVHEATTAARTSRAERRLGGSGLLRARESSQGVGWEPAELGAGPPLVRPNKSAPRRHLGLANASALMNNSVNVLRRSGTSLRTRGASPEWGCRGARRQHACGSCFQGACSKRCGAALGCDWTAGQGHAGRISASTGIVRPTA